MRYPATERGRESRPGHVQLGHAPAQVALDEFQRAIEHPVREMAGGGQDGAKGSLCRSLLLIHNKFYDRL